MCKLMSLIYIFINLLLFADVSFPKPTYLPDLLNMVNTLVHVQKNNWTGHSEEVFSVKPLNLANFIFVFYMVMKYEFTKVFLFFLILFNPRIIQSIVYIIRWVISFFHYSRFIFYRLSFVNILPRPCHTTLKVILQKR